MTARQRVGRARTYLAVAVAIAAAVWSATAALAASVVIAVVAGAVEQAIPRGVFVVPAVAALFAAVFVVYRAWPGRSLERVALWVEEHEPRLAFALVTATDRLLRPSPALERAAAFDLKVVRAPLAKMVASAAAALLASAAVSWALTGADGTRDLLRGRSAAATPATAAGSVDPLAGVRAVITPPAYSRMRSKTVDDPSTIAALHGSTIVVTGTGSGVSAFLGEEKAPVAGGSRWRMEFPMPRLPLALTLRHGERQRVLVLEPISDAAPRVRLVSPTRDTIMPRATGVVRVVATIEDDIGISDGFIEYMLSSGAEETFTARTVVTGRREFRATSRGDLSATINLGTLNLGPGDLVSIRAVARDGNIVSGRGVGVSDTRTYRVARRDEYDSLAIEAGAPIVPESTVVSQRMLILRTEALLREQPALTSDSVLTRVRAIATDQIRLRERVHDIIYPAHTHAEGEVEAEGEPEDVAEGGGPINPHLRTAYEEMWSASRELQIAEPATALPFMRAAAAALDRARLANRYYLRSGVSRVVVDVPRVRLTGTDKGSSSTRAPHPPITAQEQLAREFARAAVIADARRAADELSLIRVRALTYFPELAAALQPAIEALRRGRDASGALSAARAAIDAGASLSRDAAGWSRW